MGGKPGPVIGVLALQGAFREHRRHLEALGAKVREVRLAGDLNGLDGVILPGGESTTMARLLSEYDLWEPLRSLHRQGAAVWGTCAGAILLAADVLGAPPQDGGYQRSLQLLDMTVQRNAFGRQRESFAMPVEIRGLGEPFEGVFIRAPAFSRVGDGIDVLARVGGLAVMVQQERILASAFHPELTRDLRLHAHFLELAGQRCTPANT